MGFDFICPTCLMSRKNNSRLNTIADIAYAMPDELFRKLCDPLQKDYPELTKEMNEKSDLICCITWADIDNHLTVHAKERKILRGTYKLTSGWLKDNALRFGLTYEGMMALPDDIDLLEEDLDFYFDMVDGARFPTKIRMGDKRLISDERRCAHCGRLLSPDTGRAKEVRIILQGSSRSGKTSCIIALFAFLLKNNYLVKQGFRAELANGQGPDADDVKHYHNWIKQELEYYHRNIKVEKTDTNQTEPIVYSLLVKVDNRELVLSLVDMPGEYFDKADKTQQEQENLLKLYMPIYEHCDVVWTCLRYETLVSQTNRSKEQWDKLENEAGLTQELAAFAEYKKYYQRFMELINEFESYKGKKMKHAVILTITDSIISVYNPPEEECEQLRRHHIIPSKTEKMPELVVTTDQDPYMIFQERSCHKLCDRVSTYIKKKNSNLHALFAHFTEHTKYFAMAAYGHPALPRPSSASELVDTNMTPSPFQVEAPLLWTLAICGHLPIEYTASCYRKLGPIERILQRKSTELAGNRRITCQSIHDADSTAWRNLLNDMDGYENHTITLGRGESV